MHCWLACLVAMQSKSSRWLSHLDAQQAASCPLQHVSWPNRLKRGADVVCRCSGRRQAAAAARFCRVALLQLLAAACVIWCRHSNSRVSVICFMMAMSGALPPSTVFIRRCRVLQTLLAALGQQHKGQA